MIYLNVFRLDYSIELPTYGTSMSSCFDLSFHPTKDIVKGYDAYNTKVGRQVNALKEVVLHPGDRLLIPTGLIFKIDQKRTIETYADIARAELPLQNYSIRLHPRSGLSLKQGLVLANSEGIIDVDYQEEVFVLLTNISKVNATIQAGNRIAQGEIVCNEPFEIGVLNSKPEQHSERNGGFGSTGVAS